MLSPFDDYPIHPSADPIAHTATGDPNHYDRYWFNGHARGGGLFFAASMGHYPVRGTVDAAFAVVVDGVSHSVFASGRMPLDRSTKVGPIRIEVIEPMRVLRYVVEPNEHGISADLVFSARTSAVEEPRQRKVTPQGVLAMDHTRMTQWGRWEGVITVDGREFRVDPDTFPGTRDRSWGVRPVGEQVSSNHAMDLPQIAWFWAPIHFEDFCTHVALHEYEDGKRWVESALVLEDLPLDAAPWGGAGVGHCRDIEYDLTWVPGTRLMDTAEVRFTDPAGERRTITMEKLFTFRMRGIGYWHPEWSHGSNKGELATGRESVALDSFEPNDFTALHVQHVVRARMGDQVGIGVLENAHIGPHRPTGLTGFLDGYAG
jgi:hypothetical protein